LYKTPKEETLEVWSGKTQAKEDGSGNGARGSEERLPAKVRE